MSFRRTLRAMSTSCCQVVASIGTPFFSRSTRRARSGSPGVSTSAHAGLRLGRLHPGDEVLDLVLEQLGAAHRCRIDDDRQHVVDDVGAVLLDGARRMASCRRSVRRPAGRRSPPGRRPCAGRTAGWRRRARCTCTPGSVVGIAGRVDQQAGLHLDLLVVGDPDLARRHLAGGEVEHDRLLALARHRRAVGVGGEARPRRRRTAPPATCGRARSPSACSPCRRARTARPSGRCGRCDGRW